MKNKNRCALITGYSKKEFVELNDKEKSERCCYWCRKRDGKKSIFWKKGRFGIEKTALLPFVQKWKKVWMIYFVCRECYLCFAAMSRGIKKDRAIIEKVRAEK